MSKYSHKVRTYLILKEMFAILDNMQPNVWNANLIILLSDMKEDVETTEGVKFNMFGQIQ